jgi:neutral ceramidase
MRTSFAAVLMCVLGTMVARANEANLEPIAVGVAVVDITPPVPYRMCGYFYERPSTGTHDPLLAKAIVLRQKDQQVALVFCDIIGISADTSGRARQLASEKTGIPAANIMVAGTHSHTGPLFFGALHKMYHDRAAAKNNGRDPLEAVDYPDKLAQGIAQAVTNAQAALGPAQLEVGTPQEPKLSFNRRFHMKDGSVRFNPGFKNPDIVRAAGPIDPGVGLLLVRGADAKPLVSLTVFALHLDTTSGTLYSADYPYYLSQSLRKQFGDQFVSLFGTGTCGDINHFDVTTTTQRTAEQIGTQLAETVKKGLTNVAAVKQPSLAIAREIVAAPIQKYTADEIARAKETMVKAESGGVPFLEQVRATKIMDLQLRKGNTLPLEVQAVRFGNDVALVALPGEVFVELGLAIKKGSPFKTTMVVELANDCPAYVPTQKAFTEGSYETVNSRVQSGGGEMMAEAALRLLEQLK